jgi:hypothetical protein
MWFLLTQVLGVMKLVSGRKKQSSLMTHVQHLVQLRRCELQLATNLDMTMVWEHNNGWSIRQFQANLLVILPCLLWFHSTWSAFTGTRSV